MERYEEELGIWLDVRAYPVLDETGSVTKVIEHVRDISKKKQKEKELQDSHDLLGKRVEQRTADLKKTNEALQSELIDRGRTEKVLRQERDFTENLIDTAQVIILALDTEGRIVSFNRYMEKLSGYRLEEVKGKDWFSTFLPEQDYDRIREVFLAAVSDIQTQGNINPIVARDGREIVIEWYDKSLNDADGNTIGLLSIGQDITTRLKAEEALRESEAKYRQLLNHAPAGIFEVDFVKQKFVSVNDMMCEYTGYTREEMLSMGPFYILTEKSKKVFAERIGKLFAGETVPETVEFKIRKKDGRELWVLLNSNFLYENGKPKGATVVVRDITKRKQAEEELKESEKRLRTILDSIPAGVVIIDMETRTIVDANPAAMKIMGDSKEQIVGQVCHKYICPAEKRACPIIDLGQKVDNSERILLKANGEEVPILKTVAPILLSGKECLLESFFELTEKKKLESQLQQAQKMESIGTLAGGIAHDFNNLLMGIQGRTSLMLMNKDSSYSDFEHLKGIEDYVESAADLTRQLLGFARSGKYNVKPTDINEMINKSSGMFGRTKKEIDIHRKYQKDVWTIETDRGQIEQVLMNLYVNAWQAMPGGGDLFVQTENISLDEDYIKPFSIEPGRYVKISITDTGVGMDKATREKIFEPFFTTKEMGRGTGLGLASAYGIIKNHSGFINVYSEKGEGTTFNIYLPASEKEIIEEKKLPEDLLRGSETVLLVDDEDMIIDVGEQLLEKMGYTVLIARSGKEAIGIYKKNKDKIDIVLLDMIMPDMSGSDTFDSLKKINPGIKVLLSSGYSINGQATEILERGCDGFIHKPFNMKQLSRKLREILDK